VALAIAPADRWVYIDDDKKMRESIILSISLRKSAAHAL